MSSPDQRTERVWKKGKLRTGESSYYTIARAAKTTPKKKSDPAWKGARTTLVPGERKGWTPPEGVNLQAIAETKFWQRKKVPEKIVRPPYAPPKPRVDGAPSSAADRAARHYIPKALRFTAWYKNRPVSLRTVAAYRRGGERIRLSAFNSMKPETYREPSSDVGTVFDGQPIIDPKAEHAQLFALAYKGQHLSQEVRATLKVAVLASLGNSTAETVRKLAGTATPLTRDQVRHRRALIAKWRPEDIPADRALRLKQKFQVDKRMQTNKISEVGSPLCVAMGEVRR